MPLKCLDVFTGIGGMTQLLDVEYVAMVEIDPHAQTILRKRFPGIPIVSDICTLDPPPHDILTGGFPCQDISSAGLRKGLNGTKSILFFEMLRIIKKVHPSMVFIENVGNIISMNEVMQTIVDSLVSEGYDIRWCSLTASQVGAPMARKRWFCLCKKARAPMPTSVDLPIRLVKCAKVVNGKYTGLPNLDLPQVVRPVLMKRFEGDRKCAGKVVNRVVSRRRWATPRTRISYACRNLTYRGCNDLASQLRFAVDTPVEQKVFKSPCIEWVEWLMGVPIGFTDVTCESPVAHNGWTHEPSQRLSKRTKEGVKRHFRLGNMCVPQMAKKAFEILNKS